MRAFVALVPGTALHGARVRAIDAAGVTFESGGRAFGIAFGEARPTR